MPLYVYAKHEFQPENEDEVPFRAGEKIEVLEKDDMYGDGWWQGKNLAGRIGLFPVSYTDPDPPPPVPKLPPADSAIMMSGPAKKTDSEPSSSNPPDISSKPSLQPLHEESETESSPPAAAPAIYLNGEQTQGSASVNNIDGEVTRDDGEVMHATMTDVQKAIEQLGRNTEDGRSFSFASSRDGGETPSDTDFDDTDDGRDDGEGWHKGARRKLAEKARRAVEEAEKLEMMMEGSRRPPLEVEFSDESDGEEEEEEVTTFQKRYHSGIPEEEEPVEQETETVTDAIEVPARDETELPTATAGTFIVEPEPAVIPPATIIPAAMPEPAIIPLPGSTSKHTSVASSSSVVQQSVSSDPAQTLVDSQTPGDKNPSTWTVDEVIDWLKSKGFGQDVCEKFTEQEITGDVLLALDVNLLKTEIGIIAFGKRMRIANAITDLRRPPSIEYDDHQPNRDSSQNSPSMLAPYSPGVFSNGSGPYHHHSRTQSLSQSHHSYPGSLTGTHLTALMSPESAPHTGDAPGSPGWTNGQSHRPAHLALSPSDSNLTATALAVSQEDDDRGAMSESEAIPAQTMRRRIFGRSHDSKSSKDAKSTPGSPAPEKDLAVDDDVTKEKEKNGKDEKDKEKTTGTGARHSRSRRSIDASTSKDRLSIFGTSFGGTLGKSRKPPPRYSVTPDDADKEKNGSAFHLPRLGNRKASNGRPSTADGTSNPKEAMMNAAKGSLNGKDKPSPNGKDRDPALLRKRTTSHPGPSSPTASPHLNGAELLKPGQSIPLKPGQSILDQIGTPDHSGFMRKRSDRYNSWKSRFFVLKGPHLYYLRNDSKTETKIKGYINIIGYKVTVDENVNPGRYGFRIDHDTDKPHFFSSDEKMVVRDWMKAIMKATIGRDYSKPVISSCNIPTIPLMVAQAMNPAPRPPSPTARDATQKALRRENPNQLSSRDARVLMGLPSSDDHKEERTRLESFFKSETVETPTATITPSIPPPRSARRSSVQQSVHTPVDENLIDWANSHLPLSLQISESSLCSGLGLLRLAESIKGRPSSPPVPDSAFPTDPTDDKLDGLFRLFDFLLDNDVKMGSVSINDIRAGKRDKVVQLLKALKSWEDKRKAVAMTIGKGHVQAGAFMLMA
ncbi:hypothetical protein C8J56DRAFT_912520 [Mycena floridula]|nr:hypothetical protein C8J56DRAFT_912520 [Mycena floridula]